MMNYNRESKEPKQEGENISRVPSSFGSSSGAWCRTRDPRIVRVSRAFGGKDRHSKVCTVRGLRDRRVRLSVPTAIQLYDLQDRLGLSQPSKVVDWLLEAAKNDIDELPPLPNIIHPLNFAQPSFFTDQNRVVNSSENNWGRNIHDIDEKEQEQEEEGSEEQIIPANFGHNNPFLFPYGYSEPSQLQLANESHGFVSIAHHHHHHQLIPSMAPLGNYIPMPYLRTSLVEMDHQLHMAAAAAQQLQIGSGSLFSGRSLPFNFDVNARVAPSNDGGKDLDRE